MEDFIKKFTSNQVDLLSDFSKVVDDNFWELAETNKEDNHQTMNSWSEEVEKLFEQRFGFDSHDEYTMAKLIVDYKVNRGFTPEQVIDELERLRAPEIRGNRAKVVDPSVCELEGPYECLCGGHMMLDSTYLEQVSDKFTCPYCRIQLKV